MSYKTLELLGLLKTGLLKNKKPYNLLHEKIDVLGREIELVIKGIDVHHQTKRMSIRNQIPSFQNIITT